MIHLACFYAKKYSENIWNDIKIPLDINEIEVVLDDNKAIKTNMSDIYKKLYKIYNL